MDVDQETTRSDEAFVDQLARDLYTGSRKLAGLSTLELMEGCGIDPGSGYHIVAQCGWVFIDDAALSEAHRYLDGLVSEKRLQKIRDGYDLNRRETRLAHERYGEHQIGDGLFTLTHYYRVRDSRGRPIYFSSDHGDGGVLEGCGGPWKRMPTMTRGLDGERYCTWTVLADDLEPRRR